jgi:hypothetical protein
MSPAAPRTPAVIRLVPWPPWRGGHRSGRSRPTADPRSRTTATTRPDPTRSCGWTRQWQADARHRGPTARRAGPHDGRAQAEHRTSRRGRTHAAGESSSAQRGGPGGRHRYRRLTGTGPRRPPARAGADVLFWARVGAAHIFAARGGARLVSLAVADGRHGCPQRRHPARWVPARSAREVSPGGEGP